MLVSAVLTFRGRTAGLTLYLGVFAGTLLWALRETGLHFWPLVPRLVAPVFLAGVALLLLPAARCVEGKPACTRGARLGGAGMLAVFAAFFALMFVPHDVIRNKVTLEPGEISATTEASGQNWSAWGKTGEGLRYSTAEQITPENVGELEIAWTARTGFIADQSESKQDQNTPLYVDGTLFQCAAGSQVTALDGTTGEIKWQFDPEGQSPFWKRCRTVAYHASTPGDACGPRIVMSTTDMRLISLKASDGSLCETFGDGGTVDLAEGIGQISVLDRRDGTPINPVEERPVPQAATEVAGEYYAKTQPYSPQMAVIGGELAQRETDVGRDADRPDALPDPLQAGELRGRLHPADHREDHRLPGQQRRDELGQSFL
ncbi:PQQ-binding-like beta-propeller repeat protein [Yangia mangrovi]|uniref:PQQ-binding-like beta-propeller repeat protein n=1 Tax=Alloyangia mangrovi TaxID=1779329 RepID=A0A2A3JWX9_9RHOB|nr:PQQ-binding-like beta-propeller repeat protein [Alloyangia mangrovi]MCT4371823.1 PQQ-binding-like beta-propeller repeat protein [Alloyangia mangrovi]